jgi:hypothetical protein
MALEAPGHLSKMAAGIVNLGRRGGVNVILGVTGSRMASTRGHFQVARADNAGCGEQHTKNGLTVLWGQVGACARAVARQPPFRALAQPLDVTRNGHDLVFASRAPGSGAYWRWAGVAEGIVLRG